MIDRIRFFCNMGLIGMVAGFFQWLMYRQGIDGLLPWWTAAFFLLAPWLFVIPNVLEPHLPLKVTRWLAVLGGFWFIFCYYSLFVLIIYVLGYGGSWLLHMLPAFHHASREAIPWVLGLIWLVILWGCWQAYHPQYRRVEIRTTKPLGRTYTIAFASDIHLGPILGQSHAAKLSRMLNEAKPDIILLGGDIIDGNLDYVLKNKSYENMQLMTAPLGVYAAFGNHDHYSGRAEEVAAIMAPAITFVGGGTIRPAEGLEISLMNDYLYYPHDEIPITPKGPFKVVVDHEPWRIVQAERAGYDLYLAGHTHAGQFFPNNLVTRRMYLLDHGTKRFGFMWTIVSNGFGFWGIPVRVGAAPEVVVITIVPGKQAKLKPDAPEETEGQLKA